MARLMITDEKGNQVEVDTETGEARKLKSNPGSIWRDLATMTHLDDDRPANSRPQANASRQDS